MNRIVVDDDKCRGCALCVEFCPKNVLRLADRFNRDGLRPVEMGWPERCIGCATCATVCPHVAIVLVERAAKHKVGETE